MGLKWCVYLSRLVSKEVISAMNLIVECPGGTPIIFSWGCAAVTLRTLTYTRPC